MIGKKFASDDEVLARLRRLEHRVNSIQVGPGNTITNNIVMEPTQNFVELLDVPQTYAATGNFVVRVKSTNDQLEFAELKGTTNRVTVTPHAADYVFSLPQDIHTAATPTFAGIYLKSSTIAPFLKLTNESDTARNPVIQFAVGATPVTKFTMGVDDSDSDVFKLSAGSALGTTDLVKVTETYTEIYNTLYAGFAYAGIAADTNISLVTYSFTDAENRGTIGMNPGWIYLTAQDLNASPGESIISFNSSKVEFTTPIVIDVISPLINILDNGELRFHEAIGVGPTNYIGIRTPVVLAASYILILPTATAGAKKHLYTDASDALDWGQNVDTDSSPTFVALNLSATSNQIVLQSAGITGTITATPASSNKIWTLQDVTGTIYQTAGMDVAVADGGTNKSAWTLYAIPYASGVTTIGEIAIGTAGQVLAVNGGANGYRWAAALSNPMTDIGDMIIGGAAGAPTKLADVAVGSYMASGGLTSAPAWATLNQAAVAGLTTAGGPTFDHVHLTSGQVGFPAVQVPSADVNILDDYEEGTWTPVYAGTTGSIGATAYSTQTGTYTKIGRVVTVTAIIVLTNNGDWTGNVIITGLPFTATTFAWGAILVSNITYDGQLVITPGGAVTYCAIYVSKTGAALALLACSGVPDNGRFYFTVTYTTT